MGASVRKGEPQLSLCMSVPLSLGSFCLFASFFLNISFFLICVPQLMNPDIDLLKSFAVLLQNVNTEWNILDIPLITVN